jgi:hypothetical protein
MAADAIVSRSAMLMHYPLQPARSLQPGTKSYFARIRTAMARDHNYHYYDDDAQRDGKRRISAARRETRFPLLVFCSGGV